MKKGLLILLGVVVAILGAPWFLGVDIDQTPTPAPQIAIWIGPLLLLALAIFGFGVSKEKEGGKPFAKFVSLLPLGIAYIYGVGKFRYALDPLITTTGTLGGRTLQLHYVAFFAPLLAILFVLVWGIVSFTRGDDHDDY